jgi:hypothetical protein
MYLPLLAEFGGERGLQCLQWLARRLGPGSNLLWTQYYVARSTAC